MSQREIPYWKARDRIIERRRSKTERLRPDVGPGAVVLGLSLPQQEPRRLADAVQKHQVTLVARQVRMEALLIRI